MTSGIKQREVAQILGVSMRQIKRWVKAVQLYGPQAFVSKRRGKPSNRKHTDAFKDQM